MSTTPRSPVHLETATLQAHRAAGISFDDFLAALREEREACFMVLLNAAPEQVLVAQGAAKAVDSLVDRITNAQAKLVEHQRRAQKKEGARYE